MHIIRWSRYPTLATNDDAKRWLQSVADLGLASNTVEAYGRAVEQYLYFSTSMGVLPKNARRDHIAALRPVCFLEEAEHQWWRDTVGRQCNTPTAHHITSFVL